MGVLGGRLGVLVRNFRTMRMTYLVNVFESSVDDSVWLSVVVVAVHENVTGSFLKRSVRLIFD